MALSDNLQGWWCPSLDTAGNGTTTLTDLSGNGNNGTLTNMDAATDWVADTANGGVRALDLDGSNDFVNISSFVVQRPLTWSIWVYLRRTTLQPLLTKHRTGNPAERTFSTYADGVNVIAYNGDSTGAVNTAGGAVTYLNGWHMVTGRVSAEDGTRLFFDGVSIANTPSTIAEIAQTTRPIRIGAFADGFAADMRFDSAAIWSRALTADEVAQLYNGGRSLNLLASGNIAHVLRSIQQQHESVVAL